jgi:hypothetical protein
MARTLRSAQDHSDKKSALVEVGTFYQDLIIPLTIPALSKRRPGYFGSSQDGRASGRRSVPRPGRRRSYSRTRAALMPLNSIRLICSDPSGLAL